MTSYRLIRKRRAVVQDKVGDATSLVCYYPAGLPLQHAALIVFGYVMYYVICIIQVIHVTIPLKGPPES